MCVIIYKPAGAEIPAKELLAKAYRRNPHGCGLVSPSVIYKGLSYASFESSLNKCSKNEPMLIHFRFATHGSAKKSNCHPFFDENTDVFFMHNGVLHGFDVKDDKTDSEIAFRKMLAPYIRRYGLDSKELAKMVDLIRGASKFAFMQKNRIYLFGDFIYRDGLYFSNLRFM